MELTAVNVSNASPHQRKVAISAHAALVTNIPRHVDADLEPTYRNSVVINGFIDELLVLQRQSEPYPLSPEAQSNLIRQNLSQFYTEIEASLTNIRDEIHSGSHNRNIYEIADANKLAFASNATRNLSTKLGLLWEKIASFSPDAINPEDYFGLKIKGVDLILKNHQTDTIEYAQLKTQKNTLTGSQKTRSVNELSLHQNPVFCAALNASSWTFNHPSIPRVAGPDFWHRIGFDYEIVIAEAKLMVDRCEDKYVELLNSL